MTVDKLHQEFLKAAEAAFAARLVYRQARPIRTAMPACRSRHCATPPPYRPARAPGGS